MKAKFNSDNSKDKKAKSSMFHGDYETMLKERQKKLPELEAAVQEVLNDWNGETLCVIKIHEDENGDPSGQHVFIGGVSKLGGQLALGKVLIKTADGIRDRLLDIIKDDPSKAREVLGEMLEFLANNLKKREESNNG